MGVVMIFFGQLIQRNALLRQAQHEVARLAVSEERARLARDLHDSLGHSLTVVAVKSELARKLVSRDPVRAEAEIADIERLAREGLADLRAAVAGYRDVDLEAELASARTALAAAGITAHLPDDAAVVRPELRALFGWVVREG
ncbi:sensor histidine kinase [Pseudolysinimonas kribbensis]|uniref:sensor histidine kinase n=1 Tax=Pseudolysinimonas kribbensis TaxID=433641 RepID=UPI0024E12FAD|nr:histidine kinase [Pseudolysinimonas kribbensis]